MPASAGVAEIRFAEPELTLIGCVESADRKEVRLEFAAPPPTCARQPGCPADLVLVRKASIYCASARIASASDSGLTLALVGPVHRVNQRAAPRYAIAIPVAFRVVRPSGYAGAWQAGISTDLSVSGLCLRTDHPLQRRDRLELRLNIPPDARPGESGARTDPAHKASADSHSEERPLRAKGVVANRRFAPDGACILGLQLSYSDPRDQIRIVRFTSILARQAPGELPNDTPA